MTDYTDSLHLTLPDFDISPWHDQINDNFTILDAAFKALTGLVTEGIWQNDTAYVAGQRVIDADDGNIWTVALDHTSSAAPITFAQDRASFPAYWVLFTAAVANKGQWQTGVLYNINDFVYDANRFGVVTNQYLSGASYDFDVSGGKIVTLIDMSTYVTNGIGQSINLAPVKATPADADEFGYADSTTAFNLKKFTWAQFAAAMQSKINSLAGIVAVGALAVGSIVPGFGNINIGSSVFTGDNAGIFPEKYISGSEIQNNVTDPTNDIDFMVGECCTALTPYYKMKNNSTQTKRLDALWTVGHGSGGLDQGVLTDTTYHCHRIRRPDTGVVDHLFSLSHDEDAPMTISIASPAVVTWYNPAGSAPEPHGLRAGSTVIFSTTAALPTGVVAGQYYYVLSAGLTDTTFRISATNGGAAINTSGTQSGSQRCYVLPLLPANYTQYRRIGSIIRTAGVIVPFDQKGDNFALKSVVLSYNSAAAMASTLTAFAVPYGIKTQPMLTWRFVLNASSSGVCAFGGGDLDSNTFGVVEGTTTAGITQILRADTLGGGYYCNRNRQVWIQVAVTSGSFSVGNIYTAGWIDRRGR